MAFLNTVKGWLNIGGVKVQLQGVNQRVSRSRNSLDGKVLLTSKGDKLVLKMTYKFVMKQTTGRGEEQKVKEFTIAEIVSNDSFEMKTGESKTLDFSLPYSLERSLKDERGIFGAVGKLGAMAAAEKDEYFVIAECDVKGTALDPGDRVEVTLVD